MREPVDKGDELPMDKARINGHFVGILDAFKAEDGLQKQFDDGGVNASIGDLTCNMDTWYNMQFVGIMDEIVEQAIGMAMMSRPMFLAGGCPTLAQPLPPFVRPPPVESDRPQIPLDSGARVPPPPPPGFEHVVGHGGPVNVGAQSQMQRGPAALPFDEPPDMPSAMVPPPAEKNVDPPPPPTEPQASCSCCHDEEAQEGGTGSTWMVAFWSSRSSRWRTRCQHHLQSKLANNGQVHRFGLVAVQRAAHHLGIGLDPVEPLLVIRQIRPLPTIPSTVAGHAQGISLRPRKATPCGFVMLAKTSLTDVAPKTM